MNTSISVGCSPPALRRCVSIPDFFLNLPLTCRTGVPSAWIRAQYVTLYMKFSRAQSVHYKGHTAVPTIRLQEIWTEPVQIWRNSRLNRNRRRFISECRVSRLASRGGGCPPQDQKHSVDISWLTGLDTRQQFNPLMHRVAKMVT